MPPQAPIPRPGPWASAAHLKEAGACPAATWRHEPPLVDSPERPASFRSFRSVAPNARPDSPGPIAPLPWSRRPRPSPQQPPRSRESRRSPRSKPCASTWISLPLTDRNTPSTPAFRSGTLRRVGTPACPSPLWRQTPAAGSHPHPRGGSQPSPLYSQSDGLCDGPAPRTAPKRVIREQTRRMPPLRKTAALEQRAHSRLQSARSGRLVTGTDHAKAQLLSAPFGGGLCLGRPPGSWRSRAGVRGCSSTDGRCCRCGCGVGSAWTFT